MFLSVMLLCWTQFWTPGNAVESCSIARLKCAYRVGCGTALQEYMVQCARIMSGESGVCSSNCKRSLIALTSTEEGHNLMQCECGDDFCKLSKQRVEVCRPEVTQAVATGTVVSCAVAQWICIADHLCSTALNYYHRFCRGMFEGHRCTARCNNSVAILNRQEKAAKLRDCRCDGTEGFPCRQIKANTAKLCFRNTQDQSTSLPDTTTDVDNDLSPIASVADHKQQRKRNSADLARTLPSCWWTLLLVIALIGWTT